jgi:hypothetical protein
MGRIILLVSSVCVVLAGVVYVAGTQGTQKRDVESMYHMWLGPNGLPISPRKQRAKLFEFCTTHFVTEAEMRYCYARLLSVGNPSGPVKYAGQPQYDSEQVVSPLFTFAMPPSSPPPPPPAPPAAQAPPVTLSSYGNGAVEPISLATFAARPRSATQDSFAKKLERERKQQAAEAANAETQAKLREVEREVSSLKAELHAMAAKKAAAAKQAVPVEAPKVAKATPMVMKAPAAPKAAKAAPIADPFAAFEAHLAAATAAAKPKPSSTAAIRSRLSAVAAAAAAQPALKSAAPLTLPKGQGLNSVFYLPSSSSVTASASAPWFHKQPALGI